MKPNATLHNPDPDYIRGLIAASGLSQLAAARQIGISGRMLRHYLAGTYPVPYAIQFALESLPKTGSKP